MYVVIMTTICSTLISKHHALANMIFLLNPSTYPLLLVAFLFLGLLLYYDNYCYYSIYFMPSPLLLHYSGVGIPVMSGKIRIISANDSSQ